MTVSLPAQAEWRAKVDWSAELADGHHYAAHGGRDAPFAIPSRLAPWLFDDAPLLASIRRRVPALSPLQLGDQCEDPQSDHESRILCSPVSFLLRAHGGLWVCRSPLGATRPQRAVEDAEQQAAIEDLLGHGSGGSSSNDGGDGGDGGELAPLQQPHP